MARFSSCTACSPLYNTFRKVRFAEQLQLANMSPGNRGEIIRVLLESAKVGSHAHNQLIFAHIMDDDAKLSIEKLVLLWCIQKSDELSDALNLHRDFGEVHRF